MLNIQKFWNGLRIKAKAASASDTAGELEVISTNSNKLTYHNGTTASAVVTEAHTATLTNKTFDAEGTGNSILNIKNADIKAGAAIDATKIADGSVTSTEFQYINTLSSNAQTQIDTKVTGPVSATDERLVRFDGSTGKLVQDGSTVTLTDAGIMSGATQLNVDNIRLDGNTVSSTDTNGNILLAPDGTGNVGIGVPTPGYILTVSDRISVSGNTAGLIINNTEVGREELRIQADTDAFDENSNGSGIFLYGNGDSEHPGAMAFLTGADGAGDAKMIITQDKLYMGYNIYDYSDAGTGEGIVNIKDAFTGTASTGPALFIDKDALSSGGVATSPQSALRLNWTEETQDISTGEGMAIEFSAKLVADVTSTVVASIASYKEQTSDTNRQSSIVFSTSSDGSSATTEKARIYSDGTFAKLQPTHTGEAAGGTLTMAEVRTGIINFTGSVGSVALPTATEVETSLGAIDNTSIDFSVVNTGSGACTLTTATLTTLGSLVVTNGTSGIFRIRRTGTNAATIYRIA